MAALSDYLPPLAPSVAVSYETYATDGKGQGLRATKRIEINELIFKEEPFIWHSKIAMSDYACHSCGRYLRCTDGNRSVSIVRCTQCPTLCKAVYCNLACEQESLKNGHRFVCAGRSETFDAYIDQTNGDCHLSHSLRLLGIALVFYRRVAEFCYSRQITGTTVTAMEAVTHLLLGFQRVDYCRTVHALRCGRLDVDEEMFATMIAPAYFASHLEVPLELIKEIMSNEDCWGSGDEGRLQADIFVNSEIFQPLFFRELMGSFAINNLEVRIHDDNEAVTSNLSSTNTDTAADLLRSFERAQRHENDDVLRGTGLNHLYSRMNHSCNCNTHTACGSRAEVSVYALRVIEPLEEVQGPTDSQTVITTTYLHMREDADGASLGAFKQRRRALLQYLFLCTCPMCEEQKSLRTGDDSSDDDY